MSSSLKLNKFILNAESPVRMLVQVDSQWAEYQRLLHPTFRSAMQECSLSSFRLPRNVTGIRFIDAARKSITISGKNLRALQQMITITIA